MALPLRLLLGGYSAGGSLAFGELVDDYGEELYLDLKQYWNFDLADFLAGEVNSCIPLIFAMIRQLPEGSRFSAAMRYDHSDAIEEVKTTDRDKAISDIRTWTLDRELLAMIINAVNTNTVLPNSWKDDKPPNFPIIGPEAWQPTNKIPEEPKDLADVLKRMGWPGGG